MEDNLQRVFSILISVLILFILPLYITFEKIDDISYSLALKITSNFVDNVTAKGYVSKEMYNDFVTKLSVTGNVYDVKMEHLSRKYEPIIYTYGKDENQNRIRAGFFDYALYSQSLNTENGKSKFGTEDIEISYKVSEIKYSQAQILKILDGTDEKAFSDMTDSEYKNIDIKNINSHPYMYANYTTNQDGKKVIDNNNRIYTMNKGDEFSVRIKNENVTVATVLFNAFTLGIGGTENNTRIYINYGGTIQEEEYKNLK